nr:MAG: major capsid protein [Microvirus sp.]
MQTISQHDFARIPSPSIQRSSFDRTSGHKTTFDSGFLIPIFYDEALPGDSFKLNSSLFARLNTPIVPYMDNAYLQTFFFEVPVRQVWDNWEKFNGAQDNPGDSTDYLIPQLLSPAINGYEYPSLGDYFGLPVGVPLMPHSALPFRCYNHIFNTWFRDQNLQDMVPVPKGDGPDVALEYQLLRRGKRHDYFTSSLPWPQKSDSGSVSIPLGTTAPIVTNAPQGEDVGIFATGTQNVFALDASSPFLQMSGSAGTLGNAMLADLTEATAATINQLRQSIAVQRLFEKDARGGTRYIEVIKSHFNVSSPDLRLQRPGFLGGGRSAININPVAQTQATADGVTPQANLSAVGTISGGSHGFTKSFTEHTIIIGLACVYADLTYQRGMERSWSRRTRFDFYWPELSTIGEQEVLNKEIFMDGSATDDLVFGYQERFAEYRYKPSLITGKFRSTDPQSLDFWHLSQDFATVPALSETFIVENPPFDRVIATPDEPQFKMDMYHSLHCARPMPMYGIPGLDKL